MKKKKAKEETMKKRTLRVFDALLHAGENLGRVRLSLSPIRKKMD